jgi:hypothetical protein
MGDGKISGFPPFFHSFVKSGLAEFLVYRAPPQNASTTFNGSNVAYQIIL